MLIFKNTCISNYYPQIILSPINSSCAIQSTIVLKFFKCASLVQVALPPWLSEFHHSAVSFLTLSVLDESPNIYALSLTAP